MNHDPSRLRQELRTGQAHAETSQSQHGKTFGSVEELIRHDGEQTQTADAAPGWGAPPAVARLRESAEGELVAALVRRSVTGGQRRFARMTFKDEFETLISARYPDSLYSFQ